MNYYISQINTHHAQELVRWVEWVNTRARKVVSLKPHKVLRLGKACCRLSRKCGCQEGIGLSLLTIAHANRVLSNNFKSMMELLEAQQIFEKLYHVKGQMRVQNLLGICYFYFGKFEQALLSFYKSLDLAREFNDQFMEATILNNIGELHRKLEQYKEALYYYEQALRLSEQINSMENMAAIHLNMGLIYYAMGQNQIALDKYQESLEYSNISKEKNMVLMGEAFNHLGKLYETLGQRQVALVNYRKSLKAFDACGNKFYRVQVLINLGQMLIQQNQEQGLAHLSQALSMGEEIKADNECGEIHSILSSYYEGRQEFAKALAHYKLYHSLEKTVRNEKLEEKLKLYSMEYQIDQMKKETEIYRHKASIDSLTGIPNRRCFNDVLEREWKRSMRERQDLSLILIDIDHFKKYNDCYGHLQGDECLREVAQTLANLLKRASDFIARYGGEEFVAVLPNTDYEGAMSVAEELRKSIVGTQVYKEQLSLGHRLTISLGAATMTPTPDSNVSQLIRAADQQLYDAKEMGRNRVCGIRL